MVTLYPTNCNIKVFTSLSLTVCCLLVVITRGTITSTSDNVNSFLPDCHNPPGIVVSALDPQVTVRATV